MTESGVQFVRKVGLAGPEGGDKLKMRGRGEHSLFSHTISDNYDVEAVKLGQARQVWHEVEDKRLSISSEESVSDYEQVRRSEAGGSSGSSSILTQSCRGINSARPLISIMN